MKRMVVLATMLLAMPSAAIAEPQVQVLAGASIPLDGDDRSSGTLDLAGKGLWRIDTTAFGVAVHWAPFHEDGQRFRLQAELQSVLSDDGALAWILSIGIGAQFVQAIVTDGPTSWDQDAVVEAGVCMAFTGWRFPPLLCLALNVGLTTGDVDAVPMVGLRF